MSNRFFLVFMFFSLLALDSMAQAPSAEISNIRIRRIADIIRRYMRANEKLTDPYVREAIFDEVGREMNLEPDEKANETSIQDIARKVRDRVNQRFPDSLEDVKKKATREAEAKFRMAEKLDPVTVRVERGRKSFTVSGIFYGYGVGGKSVRIGEHTPIAFFDLDTPSRAMFDMEFCEQEKTNYIDDKIRDYFHSKGNYTNTLFLEERGKIAEENEALGFIYAWSRWRTPRNVAEYLIEQLHSQQEEQLVAADGDGKRPEDQDPVELPTGAQDGTGGSLPDPTDQDPEDSSRKLRLAKLKKTVEEKQLEIAGSQYGIDADQGFAIGGKRILWGMAKEDVLLIFAEDVKGDIAGNVLSIEYGKTRAIEKVNLFFLNDIFYRVDTIYNIGSEEAMAFLWKSIVERYGEAAESKEMREAETARKERLEAIKNLCQPDPKKKKPTHNWDKKGICTKCGALKTDVEPAPPPLDQSYTWEGDVTTAVLNVVFTRDKSALGKFALLKKNPEIETEQNAIIEADSRRRLEDEKRRELEKFKKSL